MQTSLKGNPRFKLWQQQFGLFTDDIGVWRCGVRLGNADIPFTTKQPILLDPQHPLTALIVRAAHARVKHSGVQETLTELRSRFWIVRGRSFVRKHCTSDSYVVALKDERIILHLHPPLPSFRVKEVLAFTYTGVDYAGPLYIKATGDTKVWICLYTCCMVRAVHLKVVPDMTTQSFIRCFKRFTARRGVPVKIIWTTAKLSNPPLRC